VGGRGFGLGAGKTQSQKNARKWRTPPKAAVSRVRRTQETGAHYNFGSVNSF